MAAQEQVWAHTGEPVHESVVERARIHGLEVFHHAKVPGHHHMPGRSEGPGQEGGSSWEAAASELREALERRGGSGLSSVKGTRFGLVNSLAAQPEAKQTAWATTALSSMAREEKLLQYAANKKSGLVGSEKRAPVPAQGSLKPAGAKLVKAAHRRKQVTRDVGLVRDLVW